MIGTSLFDVRYCECPQQHGNGSQDYGESKSRGFMHDFLAGDRVQSVPDHELIWRENAEYITY